MNLGELRTYVQDVLGRTDIPEAAYVLAQDDWARRLKLQGDEATATLSSPYTLPSDFLSAVEVRCNGYRLSPVPNLPDNPVSGVPVQYKISADVLTTWPTTTDSLTIVYNKKPTRLVNAGDTSDVLTRYENVAIYGVLYHCCTLLRDAEGQNAFGGMYAQAVEQALQEDQRNRYAGGALVPTPREVA